MQKIQFDSNQDNTSNSSDYESSSLNGFTIIRNKQDLKSYSAYLMSSEQSQTSEDYTNLVTLPSNDVKLSLDFTNFISKYKKSYPKLSEFQDSGVKISNSFTINVNATSVLLANFSWVSVNMIQPIRDQGACGSCYAFAANTLFEFALTQSNPTKYKTVDLSEQQIVDCSTTNKNLGCSGGHQRFALEYFKTNRVALESSYKYVEKSQKCNTVAVLTGVARIKSWEGGNLTSSAQIQRLVQNRPVAVAVSGYNTYMLNYGGGILDSDLCLDKLDHAMVIVGWGVEKTGVKFWIVRNTWGRWWGEKGYIRIAMKDGKGICGINQDLTVAYI
eukprot:403341938